MWAVHLPRAPGRGRPTKTLASSRNLGRSIAHLLNEELSAEAAAWTDRCAGRLRQRWPESSEDQLKSTATMLCETYQKSGFSPEAAVLVWLVLRG